MERTGLRKRVDVRSPKTTRGGLPSELASRNNFKQFEVLATLIVILVPASRGPGQVDSLPVSGAANPHKIPAGTDRHSLLAHLASHGESGSRSYFSTDLPLPSNTSSLVFVVEVALSSIS